MTVVCPCRYGKQRGITLVMAIFILIVLALLGAYMANLSGVQRAIENNALAGARAYQAARAGLGWAAERLNGGGTCADVNLQTGMTFPDISGFTVALNCTLSSFQEGSATVNVYQLNARAQFGVYGNADYAYRELEMTMTR